MSNNDPYCLPDAGRGPCAAWWRGVALVRNLSMGVLGG